MKTSNSKYIDLLFCIDKPFVLGTGALIVSILEHNQDRQLRFHIYCSEKEFDFIKYNLSSRLKKLNNYQNYELIFKTYENLSLYKKLQGTINHRMLIQSIRIMAARDCEIKARNLIYADVDIICTGSLDYLADVDLGESPLAVIPNDPTFQRIEEVKGGYRLNKYFGSGVMVFNLDKWSKTSLDEKCIEFISQNKPRYPDQDALNVICDGLTFMLPKRYQEIWETKEDTVFVHYVGEKPWMPWCRSSSKFPLREINLFRKFAKTFEPNVCLWLSFNKDKDVLLNFANHRKGTKWISKKLSKRGFTSAGLYFYARHLYIKVKQKGIIGTLLFRSNTRS